MRKTIFAANWKMHKTIGEARQFLGEFAPLCPKPSAEVWIAPPATALSAAAHFVREKGLQIRIGAQNVSNQPEGAFTGEIAAAMLKEAGAQFCLIGHSERRTLYGENDEMIHNKICRALEAGLTPVLCIGESWKEREQERVADVLYSQLGAALQERSVDDVARLCIAYEPLWAIGTGKAATPELAQQAHAICRSFLTQEWGAEAAEKVPILYGGSVKPDNARSLLEKPDIDGALIGGASLDPKNFAQLIHSVEK